jgi:transketolase
MSDATRSEIETAINTIRFLAVDMVEQANSGHPGAPLGQAALAFQLWTEHLRHNPKNPEWPNRDRFVLSCGHASALLYGLLHLSGYDLPMEELRNFRQLHSKTPGHPEYGHTAGVETTTGPLGQGVGNAVGMAIAERMLASHFNRDGFPVVDHRIWTIAGDGDLMEGVSSEASSMAGHLGLGKLVVFWDDNRITIEGSTDIAFTENVVARYQAYGWHTLEVDDGNDLEALNAAMVAAAAETDRPTLVRVRTHIGFGSPKQDSEKSHGSPLGADGVKATKERLGWPLEPTFLVPKETQSIFGVIAERGAALETTWNDLFTSYRETHPGLAAEFEERLRGDLPAGWREQVPTFRPEEGPIATRKASGDVLNAIADHLPLLVGGSADLAGSNNTMVAGAPAFSKAEPGGRNFHFGVREHAMGAVMNGMALSKMLRPYGGTFLVFTDYFRSSIRLAALMEVPAIYVLTHDSIFLGEDGPTHQPVSQLLSIRSIPGLTVLRPADANETASAWKIALQNTGPTALVLTRQKLPILRETMSGAAGRVKKGAYILADPGQEDPQVLLLATGSEVHLALNAHRQLLQRGIPTRVVSMPSWELFDAQDAAYRESVLPSSVELRLAIEAGTPIGWHKYVGLRGDVLGQEGFGASAPAGALAEEFGFTVEEIVRRVEALLG